MGSLISQGALSHFVTNSRKHLQERWFSFLIKSRGDPIKTCRARLFLFSRPSHYYKHHSKQNFSRGRRTLLCLWKRGHCFWVRMSNKSIRSALVTLTLRDPPRPGSMQLPERRDVGGFGEAGPTLAYKTYPKHTQNIPMSSQEKARCD